MNVWLGVVLIAGGLFFVVTGGTALWGLTSPPRAWVGRWLYGANWPDVLTDRRLRVAEVARGVGYCLFGLAALLLGGTYFSGGAGWFLVAVLGILMALSVACNVFAVRETQRARAR